MKNTKRTSIYEYKEYFFLSLQTYLYRFEKRVALRKRDST